MGKISEPSRMPAGAKRGGGFPGDFEAQDPALQLFSSDDEKVCAPQVNGLPARKALGLCAPSADLRITRWALRD
jgi:hypothetical protein